MALGMRDASEDGFNTIFGGDASTGYSPMAAFRRRRKSKKSRSRVKKSRRSRRTGTRTVHRKRGGVKYTKNGQPYVILKSGKARFIKGRRKK